MDTHSGEQLEFEGIAPQPPPPPRPQAVPRPSQQPARPSQPPPREQERPQTPPSAYDLEGKAGPLREELEQRLDRPVHLTITNNRSSLASFRSGPGGLLKVRLHRMFLDADPDTRAALAAWLRNVRDREANAAVAAFVEARHGHPVKTRGGSARPQGLVHDLEALAEAVNEQFFEGKITSRIAWSRNTRSRRRRSITFGTYSPHQDLVRIHPLLDQEEVPEYFVAFIIFHEMLHAHLGIAEGDDGRRVIHGPDFRRLEKQHPDYARARAWQKENLSRLLSS